jgi:dephospho-CoA kinase
MRLIILIGPPGIGKTWVCNKLENKCFIASHDKFKSKLDEEIQRALEEETTIVVDIPFKIKAFIERWKEKIPDTTVIALVEPEEVHRERIAMRGGKFNETITRRIKRVASIAKRYADFVVSTEEALSIIEDMID